jgi:RNA polymerase-binding transcription factor
MSSHEYGAAVLDKNKSYRPFDKEPFMNERQRDYFRQELLIWRDES